MTKADTYEMDMLRADFRRLAQENAALRDKLALVESTLMSDWCKAAGFVRRADDFGRLHAELRAVLVAKP